MGEVLHLRELVSRIGYALCELALERLGSEDITSTRYSNNVKRFFLAVYICSSQDILSTSRGSPHVTGLVDLVSLYTLLQADEVVGFYGVPCSLWPP